MGLVKKDWVRTPDSYVLNTLGFVKFDAVTLGAAAANNVVQAVIPVPIAFKAPKVAVFAGASTLTDAFNVVYGTGAYAQGTAASNDNSETGPLPGGEGVPTNLVAANTPLFPNDVVFNTIPGFANANGFGIVVPPAYDAAFAPGVLTVRVVVAAAITKLVVALAIEPITLTQNWDNPANPQYVCTPGVSF